MMNPNFVNMWSQKFAGKKHFPQPNHFLIILSINFNHSLTNCRRVGTSCAYLEGNLPHGVTSQCRQKHAYVRLLALHPTEQRAYTDLFQFPSCCTCYIKNPFYGESTNNKSENQ